MENKNIDLNDTVHDICTAHPEIKDILITFGLKDLANPVMFNTAARFVKIPDGARNHNIDMALVIQKIRDLGFEVKQ